MILLLLSCAHEQLDTSDPCQIVHYNNFGNSFIQQYCIGCHASTATNRQGAPIHIDLESEENIIEYQQSILIELREETMPPMGGLDTDTRQTAVQWLECLETR